jgi:hypothetical protein
MARASVQEFNRDFLKFVQVLSDKALTSFEVSEKGMDRRAKREPS